MAVHHLPLILYFGHVIHGSTFVFIISALKMNPIQLVDLDFD